MKKIILSMMLVVAGLSANAQSNYVGGSLSYWFKGTDAQKKHEVTIAPEYGHNFNNKWAAGIVFDYSVTKIKDGGAAHFVGLNPYARYTIKSFGPVNVFCDGGVGVGINKVKDCDAKCGVEVGFKPGVSVTLTKQLSFVSHIGFLGYRHDYKEVNGGNVFGISLDNALDFGLYYNF